MNRKIIALTVVSVLFFASSALAQSGTVTGTPTLMNQNGRPMRMSEASLIFQAPPKPRGFQVDDFIYVAIKDKISYSNTANNQRTKKIETETGLTAWTKVAGLFKMPLAAAGPLPEIGGTIDHKTQNKGRLTHEESMELVITCRITDIRDNGNLVIEGYRSQGIGEERRIITVTGIARPDSIGQDFKVDSGQLAEFTIDNISSGNVYDTVRRPWGSRLIEQLKPF